MALQKKAATAQIKTGVMTPQTQKGTVMKPPVRLHDLRGPKGEGIRFGDTFVKAGEYPVRTLAIHEGCHWDEVVAGFLLCEFGSTFFPGIQDATLRFASREETLDDAFAALKRGELWIGCGDSPFNEHETRSRGEIFGQCAATLTAYLLGVREKPELRILLTDVLMSDREPQRDAGHIHNVIKTMRNTGTTDAEVFEWASKAVRAIYLRQLDYWQGARDSFDEVGRVEAMPTANGKTVLVAIIAADEDAFTRVALADPQKGKDAGVVVAMKGDGRLAILTKQRHGLPSWFINELFRRLALAHCQKIGKEAPRECTNGQNQCMPNDIGGLHLWWEGQGILNKGTPIGVSLEEITDIVRSVIHKLKYNGRPETSRPERHNHRPSVPQARDAGVKLPEDGMKALDAVLDASSA